jgi:hypothetical protein
LAVAAAVGWGVHHHSGKLAERTLTHTRLDQRVRAWAGSDFEKVLSTVYGPGFLESISKAKPPLLAAAGLSWFALPITVFAGWSLRYRLRKRAEPSLAEFILYGLASVVLMLYATGIQEALGMADQASRHYR